jgi:hypothetical protein
MQKPSAISVLLILLLSGFASAQAKAPASGEPPQEYVLNIDGTELPISIDRPLTVKIGEREFQIKLTPKPQRVLRLPGLAIPYPNYFTYQTSPGDPKTPQWTLQGHDTVLIVTRANAPSAAHEMVRSTVSRLTTKFGDSNVAPSTVDLTFAGKKIQATRLGVTVGESKFNYDIFALSTSGVTYLIMLQDSPDKDGASSEEAKKVTALLASASVVE